MFHNQFQNQKVCEIFNNKIVISERVIIYYINSRRISPTPPPLKQPRFGASKLHKQKFNKK